jgi:hypothetical protein
MSECTPYCDGPCSAACQVRQSREWAEQLRDDLLAYCRDRDPELRSISPALMLVRLKPLLDLLAESETTR